MVIRAAQGVPELGHGLPCSSTTVLATYAQPRPDIASIGPYQARGPDDASGVTGAHGAA